MAYDTNQPVKKGLLGPTGLLFAGLLLAFILVMYSISGDSPDPVIDPTPVPTVVAPTATPVPTPTPEPTTTPEPTPTPEPTAILVLDAVCEDDEVLVNGACIDREDGLAHTGVNPVLPSIALGLLAIGTALLINDRRSFPSDEMSPK